MVTLKTEKATRLLLQPDRPVDSGYFFSITLAKMAKANTITKKASKSSIRPTSFL